MALRTHRVPPPTSDMTFVLVRGDEVMLAARPEAGLGVVVEVLVGTGEPPPRAARAGASPSRRLPRGGVGGELGEALEAYLHDRPGGQDCLTAEMSRCQLDVVGDEDVAAAITA